MGPAERNGGTRPPAEAGYIVDLLDRGKLNAMLDRLLPEHAWYSLLERENFGDLAAALLRPE
jgi:hypothetical protein